MVLLFHCLDAALHVFPFVPQVDETTPGHVTHVNAILSEPPRVQARVLPERSASAKADHMVMVCESWPERL